MTQTWLTHLDEQKRGLAKLLAKENLTVRHENVSTAMFDIGSRTLVLPMWRDITVDQYDLLIGHEVGHALYSDDVQGWIDTLNSKMPRLKHYVNVLEDVRIEKRIKNEFPGLVGSFRRGYEDFVNNGPLFHPLRPAKTYNFIDRVNLHYKVGHVVKVPFTADEQLILKRIEACQTMQDVIALARELWQEQKEENEQKQQQQQQKSKQQDKKNDKQEQQQSDSDDSADDEESDDSSDDSDSENDEKNDKKDSKKSDDSDKDSDDSDSDDDSESSDSDADGDDESDEDDKKKPASSKNSDDDEDGDDESDSDEDSDDDSDSTAPQQPQTDTNPTSETDQQNAEALQTLADLTQRDFPAQVMLAPLPDAVMKERIITNEQIVKKSMEMFELSSLSKQRAELYLEEFLGLWNTTINHMAREFERRKSARLQERARVSRTGRLDMNKLHAYKFRDDLFKMMTTVPNGKNHGLTILIDGSSSMKEVFGKVMEQVLLFAMFAKKVNIPVQAFVFQNMTQGQRTYPQMGENLVAPSNCELLTLCDTTAGNWKQQQLVLAGYAAMYSPNTTKIISSITMPFIHLNLTPLDSGLLLVERAIAKLRQSMRLDKMSLIVLTDGDDNGGINITKSTTTRNFSKEIEFSSASAFVARDSITRKLYMNAKETGKGSQRMYQQMENMRHFMLVDSIRRRHDCRVVRIHIATRNQMFPSTTKYGGDKGIEASFFKTCIHPDAKHADVMKVMNAAMKNNKEGMFEVKQDVGVVYDAAIAIVNTMLDLKENRFEGKDVDGWTDQRIIQTFTQSNVAAKRNRIFVNTVVPYLA